MANATAVAMQKAQLYDQERKRVRQLETIGQISRQVSAYLELDELFRRAVRLIRENFGYYHVGIYTADQERQTVIFQTSASAGEQDVAFDVVWGEGLIGWVAAHRQALLVNDVETEPRYLCVEALDETRSELAVPLRLEEDVVGVLDVQSDQVNAFGPDDLFILETVGDQIAIAMQEARLFQEVTKQERMKQELDVARRIQTSFLPECCPQIEGWELATVWRSAREVSGDFYDFIPLPPKLGADGRQVSRSGVVIADVADKGVPAALFMALCRTLVRTMAMDGRLPDEAVGRANDLILADSQAGLFVTLFYTILDSVSGEIEYVNAGHLPALLIRTGHGIEQMEELRTNGIAMGVLPGVHYERRASHLGIGDLLVLYTDGVIEAQDAEQQMFGKAQLIATIYAHRMQSADELAQAIDNAVAAFVGDAPQFDDFTLVIAKRVA
jgi:sigma-B regulation protein RsbU (phosphoserine phosphatase)